MSNIIVATFTDGCTTAVTEAIYEGDYGMILQFAGLDLPYVYTVNFGNEAVSPLAHSMIGNADGVEIPNQLLTESGHIMAWVFLHTGEDDGETEYAVTIPVLEKMDTQIDDPTPEQESALNQAIAALNAGVDRAETAADSAEQIAADLGDLETAMEAVTEAKNAAEQFASDASTSAGSAAQSAQNAAQSASSAASSAEGAYASEEAAAQSAEDAESSASAAATSATNAAASEAAARAVAQSIPADYSALSANVDNLQTTLFDENALVFEIGSIIGGTPYVATNYARTRDFTPARKGMTITIDNQSDFQFSVMSVYYYSEANTASYVGATGIANVAAGQSAKVALTRDGYFKIRVARPDAAADISAGDLAAINQSFTANAFYLTDDIETLKTDAAAADRIVDNFTAIGPLDMELGGISNGQATPSDKYVRCADFVLANPGDTLIIAPTAFTAKDMLLYKYTGTAAGAYYASERIATTAAGNRVQYDFTERCYFKIRIAKNEYEVIDASEVPAFEAITTFTHYSAPGDFAPATDTIAPLDLDYDALASVMAGKINLALQTDTHMSDYTCYHNNGTAFNKSDFASFYAVLATIEKLGVDAVANLGDIVRGYEFDPDYETRQSLDKIIRGYTERTSAPKMYVIGNHDDGDLWYYGTGYNQRQNVLDVLYPYEQFSRIIKYGMQNGNNKPYYFADVAGIRFITLWQKDFDYTQAVPNTNAFSIGTDQLAWLSGTALNTTLPVVILTHAPLITSLFSIGGEGFADAMAAIQAFRTGGGMVIAVLCGHTHAQASEVADGINHIVFANGYTWFELVSIDLTGRTITCKAVNKTGLADMTFAF